MPYIHLSHGAAEAIRTLLVASGSQGPVRIEVEFKGCCDPSLALSVDRADPTDLVQEAEGLTFVLRPEVHALAGEVTISQVEENGNPRFLLTSAKPISEWEGFGLCSLKVPANSQSS